MRGGALIFVLFGCVPPWEGPPNAVSDAGRSIGDLGRANDQSVARVIPGDATIARPPVQDAGARDIGAAPAQLDAGAPIPDCVALDQCAAACPPDHDECRRGCLARADAAARSAWRSLLRCRQGADCGDDQACVAAACQLEAAACLASMPLPDAGEGVVDQGPGPRDAGLVADDGAGRDRGVNLDLALIDAATDSDTTPLDARAPDARVPDALTPDAMIDAAPIDAAQMIDARPPAAMPGRCGRLNACLIVCPPDLPGCRAECFDAAGFAERQAHAAMIACAQPCGQPPVDGACLAQTCADELAMCLPDFALTPDLRVTCLGSVLCRFLCFEADGDCLASCEQAVPQAVRRLAQDLIACVHEHGCITNDGLPDRSCAVEHCASESAACEEAM